MTAGHSARSALVIVGSILAVLGICSLAGGGFALWADGHRDIDGFMTSGPTHISTETYAVSAPSLHLDATGPDAIYAERFLGELRLQWQSSDPGAALFVGIGPADDVARYLDRVNHAEIADIDGGPFGVQYAAHPGGAPATNPAAQTFWTASDSGTGARTLTWKVTSGDWAVVIMRTDGAAGVQVDMSAGATLPVIHAIAVTSLVTGALLVIVGGVTIVATAVRRRM